MIFSPIYAPAVVSRQRGGLDCVGTDRPGARKHSDWRWRSCKGWVPQSPREPSTGQLSMNLSAEVQLRPSTDEGTAQWRENDSKRYIMHRVSEHHERDIKQPPTPSTPATHLCSDTVLGVDLVELLDLVVRAHEDTRPVMDVLRNDLEHPRLIASDGKTTGCTLVRQLSSTETLGRKH